MTAGLRVRGLEHSYGRTPVLHGIDLDVPAGTTMAILGPSGCGKSTLLRLVAGFERPRAGSVIIGDRLMVDGRHWVPPEHRGIGFVSQDGSLFPHLTVRRNVEFGLGRNRDRDRVLDLLALVSLGAEHLDRYPHELSGGQQQRVALARTLARRPGLVLLDEPFSALDTDLRAATRAAVAGALRRAGVTTLLVTHDHGEALSFAEQLAVMIEGRLRQVGSTHEVYESPADLDTARLVGGVVTLPGTATQGVAQTAIGPIPLRGRLIDGEVRVMLRPEQLAVEPRPEGTGVVRSVAYYGHDRLLEVVVAGRSVRARVPGSVNCAPGDPVELRAHGSGLAFPAEASPAPRPPRPLAAVAHPADPASWGRPREV